MTLEGVGGRGDGESGDAVFGIRATDFGDSPHDEGSPLIVVTGPDGRFDTFLVVITSAGRGWTVGRSVTEAGRKRVRAGCRRHGFSERPIEISIEKQLLVLVVVCAQ